MLDLRRLKVFSTVARLGSFSRAADALDYSQPAISHHIARLELEVGTALIDREQRGKVVLTDAGAVLLRHAELLLQRMVDAEAELARVIDASDSVLRLGAFQTASWTLVPDAIAAMREHNPETTFTLVEGEAAATLQWLQSHQIDLGIVFDDPQHPIEPEPEIELRYIYDDPMFVALRRRHPLAGRDYVDLADLREERWIEGAGDNTPASLTLMTACQAAGFEPEIAFNSGNYHVVQRLVGIGVGVALVPELAIVPDEDVVTRPLRQSGVLRRIAAAFRRTDSTLKPVQLMCETLARVCARRGKLRRARYRASIDRQK